MKPLTVLPLPGIPLVQAGDDLAAFICDACARAGITLQADDILVLAQKIVSKAENCFVRLAEVTPSAQAEALAEQVNKDPRLVEVILGDSAEVIRARPGVLITAGSGALSSPGFRLSVQMGGAPAGAITNSKHQLRAGR